MVKRSTITNTLAGILISTASNIYSQNAIDHTHRQLPSDKEIEFEKDTIWENTLEKAKKEDKLIFLDAYTDWCIPCKKMEKEVFTNDSVADFYNKKFINARINAEKGYGKEIAKNYEVNLYPTLLFIDGKGELSYKSIGAMKSSELIELGEKALKLEELVSEFEKNPENKTNGKAVYEHIKKLKEAELNYSQILENYFKTQDDLTSRINWEIIKFDDTPEKIDSKHFEYLLKNKEKLDSIYTADSVDNEIMDSFLENLVFEEENYEKENDTLIYEEAYEKWKNKVENLGFYRSNELSIEGRLKSNWRKKDWNECVKDVLALDSIYKKSGQNPVRVDAGRYINNVATMVYLNSSKGNKESMEKVLEFSKLSIELEGENWANLERYSSALYQLNLRKEAIKEEEKAVQILESLPNAQWILNISKKRLEKMKKGEKID